MSAEQAPAGNTAEAYRQAQQDYRAARAEAELSGQALDPAPLLAAAKAHLDASRPLADIKAEYDALAKAKWEDGEDIDAGKLQELAEELQPVREAAANIAGSLPGSAHAASTGIGA